MEIKIRYTWKQIKSGEIKQRIEYIENLECGQLLKEGCFMNPLWELIARDLWTQLKDKNGNEIYPGDINQDGGILKWWDSGYIWEYPSAYRHCVTGDESDWCEIVGNIHINPIKEDTNG